jgi:competence protein ComEC
MSQSTKSVLPTINWYKYPFVRFVLPFIGGVLWQYYSPFSATWLWLIPIIVGLFLAFRPSTRADFGKVIVALFFAMGAQYAQQHNTLSDDHFQQRLTTEKQQLLVRVADMPDSKQRIRAEVEVSAIADSSSKPILTSGRLLLYIAKDSLSEQIQYGDLLQLNAYVNTIEPPKNPHAFDFAQFMSLDNIYHQSFVQKDDWQVVSTGQGTRFYSRLYQIRTDLLSILKNQLPDDRNFGVAAALTLGYRTALNDEVSTAFANSGAIHVLAVSGLHVGLIAGLLMFCLNWFAHYRWYQKWIKFLIVVSGIWFFAFLTGNAASVQRASIMFTIIAAGRYFMQQGNIYNSLSVAALVSLLIDPNVLFTVGFQLSYLAVLGIVLLQPHIVQLWKVSHPVIKFFWSLLAVSLAAQLAVAPISIYYFHQFPVYFWLSSWVAVPAASVIMVLTVALFLATPVPLLADGIGWVLNIVLTALNEFIFYVNRIPFSLVDNLWLSSIEVLLWYAVFISFILSHYANRKFWRVASAVLLIVAIAMYSGRKIHQQYQDELVVYHVPNATLMDYFNGRHQYSFQSDSIEEKNVNFSASANRMAQSAQLIQQFSIDDAGQWKDECVAVDLPYIQIEERAIWVLDAEDIPDRRITVYYLLIQNNVRLSIADMLDHFEVEYMVVDGSNNYRSVKRWMEEAEELGVDLYSTQEKGAFVDRW